MIAPVAPLAGVAVFVREENGGVQGWQLIELDVGRILGEGLGQHGLEKAEQGVDGELGEGQGAGGRKDPPRFPRSNWKCQDRDFERDQNSSKTIWLAKVLCMSYQERVESNPQVLANWKLLPYETLDAIQVELSSFSPTPNASRD